MEEGRGNYLGFSVDWREPAKRKGVKGGGRAKLAKLRKQKECSEKRTGNVADTKAGAQTG